jgi:hypothetical protein
MPTWMIVAAWIKVQHDRVADHGDGDEHVRELIRNRRPSEPSRTTNFRYVRGNEERTLTVDAGSLLGKLAEVAEKLVNRYRWAPSQATVFVLTGRMPEVFVYTGAAPGCDLSYTYSATLLFMSIVWRDAVVW